MAKPKRARRAASKTQSEDAAQTAVTIRAYSESPERIPRSDLLKRLARKWGYILRARSRWNDAPEARQFFDEKALEDLEKLGIKRSYVRALARVSHIEVELHPWDPADAKAADIQEAASATPWEYLLSAATRVEGRTGLLIVTRLFRNKAPAETAPLPKKALLVISDPGRIGEDYEFESEAKRIGAAMGDADVRTVVTPTLQILAAATKDDAYDVIHVTGVDTHQAPQSVPGLYETLEEKEPKIWADITDASGCVIDGMIMQKSNVPELPVTYVELAKALVDAKRPPHVVTLNLYHSGGRTAREIVRQGAHSALGFLDEIDDEVAEAFFQEFYWAWCRPERIMAAPQAYVKALAKMDSDRLQGTTIVIWMGKSVFEPVKLTDRPTAPQHKATTENRQARLARLGKMPIGELLQVELDVEKEVNYSLLHNDRDLVSRLTLNKLVSEDLEDISVLVELNVGAESYPYRHTELVLKEPQLALAAEIWIPLTAGLPRSLGERVRSTLYVKVTCGGRVAYEDTRRITLIPVDEWVDDTASNPWLPSFVLPRDPAVEEIIKSSRQLLVGLADDGGAGFSGYQAIDTDAEDPFKGVIDQVRAIWTSLVNEYRLQYINPPPAYSRRTQRLRTPSDIVAANSGTCVDLALLLASCLEYIDIYPVLVVHSDHAFVGFWRSDEAHERFAGLERIPAKVPAVGSRVGRSAAMPYVDSYGWRLTRLNYLEIMAYVAAGDLVLLEATYLTDGSSYSDAIEEGAAKMGDWRKFDSMLDIHVARTADPPVTPLPIMNDRPRKT